MQCREISITYETNIAFSAYVLPMKRKIHLQGKVASSD